MDDRFGNYLRGWRVRRGFSQLALSAEAGVSQRHLSYLETGRSNPSREMVIHLGATLDVPLRERNLMLAAAGHTPEFGETPLDDLGQIRHALQFMVDAHAPYMAVVVDRLWNVVLSNEPATRFALTMLDPTAPWLGDRINLIRALLHPDGLRRHLSNDRRVAAEIIGRLERDTSLYPHDREMQAFLEEMRALAGPLDEMPVAPELLLPLAYEIDGRRVDLFTTIATIGAPHDVTLSELRIETFWPADETSDQRWRSLFE